MVRFGLAVLLALGPCLSLAAEPPAGWGKVRLGMNEDEVRQALAPDPVKVSRNTIPGSEAPYVTMDVERYEIAGYDFKGQFALGQQNEGLARMTFAHSSDRALNCYAELSRMLEEKYGKPGPEELSENLVALTAGRKWTLGDASVRASFSTLRNAREGYCNLTYEGKPAK